MTDSTDQHRIDRRRLLHGAAVLGVAAPVLAACGSDEGTSASTSPQPDDGSASSQSPSKPAGGGGGGGALTPTADVPVGGGVVVDAEKTVVTQPSEGEFKAFSAVCTHQGCLVSTVEDNEINCACHGSKFSAEDGSVVSGPATAPLGEVTVQVKGGNVVRS